MKLFSIIKKNLLLLYRSKITAFMILFGPLLIILLIGLVYNNSFGADNLNIGYTLNSNSDSELSNYFVNKFQEKDYILSEEKTIDHCIDRIKLGELNFCVEFPDNLDDGINKTIKFHVDSSRVNLVEGIINKIYQEVRLKSNQLTLGLVQTLVNSIDNTKNLNAKNIDLINNIKTNINQINSLNDNSLSLSNSLDLSTGSIDISKVSTSSDTTKSLASTMKSDATNLISDLNDLIAALEAHDINKSNIGYDVAALKLSANNLSNKFDSNYDSIVSSTSQISSDLNKIKSTVDTLNSKLSSTDDKTKKIKQDLNSIKQTITSLVASISTLDSNINAINANIDSIQIINADKISKPFDIKVTPIEDSYGAFTYMFTYLFVLIIMFVGILFASNQIVGERSSFSFFRTFTTPNGRFVFFFADFLTNFIIILFQLSLLLGVSIYVLNLPVLSNLITLFTALLLIISLFILLGMLIGHLFKTPNGTTITSISLGSMFLFFSNLILPIETFPQSIIQFIKLNPFVLSSELLKKIIFFNLDFSSLHSEFSILFIFTLILLLLIISLEKVTSFTFLNTLSKRKLLKRPHINDDNYFVLENGEVLKTLHDLEKSFHSISDVDYDIYVSSSFNEFIDWIKAYFKSDKKLIKALKQTHSKSEFHNTLKLYLLNSDND